MTNSPQQPFSAENVQLGPRSNKKSWIILGTVIGILVIVMGGCVACGALIGLSRLNEDGPTTSDSRTDGSGKPVSDKREHGISRTDRSEEAGALASTSWNGTLSCDDGDNLPVVFGFSAAGYPIYTYQTASGLRQVELTSPGQSLKFMPPGGGVTNIILNSISVTSDQMNHTMSFSHERSAGGTMIQSRSSVTTEAHLSGSMLTVEMTIRSSSAASQPGYLIPDESATVCRGQLGRE